ncbi:MAG TPA: glycogen debranching enzyme GlgX [Verrucomicrobia bacterium]|nr:MAG: glycogen debranching enzyme GlgX [Lentisphaerae bacterium GWF2_57_35]HBA83614.1 glycogen debranching enzyme GlgX [Verrucomicrobiota bacterium]
MKTRKHVLPSIPMLTPYGAHVVDKGVHFTLFSRHATRVWLMLFNDPADAKPILEFELSKDRNRIGNIWHVHIPEAREGQYYLYRMDGKTPGRNANFYNPKQWLLDPYAMAISSAGPWGDPAGLTHGQHTMDGACFPKGIILKDNFDWSEDHTLQIPLSETIIYETHLRGYTVHPSSGVKHPGTYKGFIEKIPYLQDLGITAVEFLPIQEFNEMEYFMENMKRKHLRNYWGYSTLAFFAPNGRYAVSSTHGKQVQEFKELVVALHKAGIEVILDVVFNHTAEGGDGGPTYSFRGIDNSIFYMMDEKGGHYKNYSGCGNTVNSNHPIVRDFILDCLRYWVLNMHVDGFRFDLASILTRGPDGEVLPNPPIVEHIAEDPALRDTKIIAEAWDAAGAYQVGSFPSERWSEWNGIFRDEIRRFWLREKGFLGRLATRLCGSGDLYDRNSQTPLKSINFITCHDGFTLRDLVSYARKHNLANAENNNDGENHNHSFNYGREGYSASLQIEGLRIRQQKNLLATLFLSQGVPMIMAGDEFCRTQKGNNNAYCQDNELSWVNWEFLKTFKELHQFTRKLIAFRKKHATLRRMTFFKGQNPCDPHPDILWFGPEGREPDWTNGHALACFIDGHKEKTGQAENTDSLFVMFNADAIPAMFKLPTAPGESWELALTTQEDDIDCTEEEDGAYMTVDSRSVTVFTSAPILKREQTRRQT